jgi:hypothetical protein
MVERGVVVGAKIAAEPNQCAVVAFAFQLELTRFSGHVILSTGGVHDA